MDLRTCANFYLYMAVFIISIIGTATQAQTGKGKEEKVPVFHYIIDDPMDVFGRQPAPQQTFRTISLPSFCRNQPKVGDTSKWFEFYNAAHELILPDTSTSAYLLHFVSMLEGYTDSLHTYRDAQGKQQLLPVSRIIHRYDRIGTGKWLFVNYKNNKTTTLTEAPDEIVASDTVASADGSSVIRRFYRTTVQK